MKILLLLPLALVAACSTPPQSTRPEIPPPRLPPPRAEIAPPVRQPVTARTPTDEAATQQWLQQQIDRQSPPPAPPAPETPAEPQPLRQATDEAATQQWLQQQIDYQNRVNPPRPPEPVYQTVERTVYVDRPVYAQDPYGYYSYPQDRGSTFPINTLFGATAGYALGGCKHRDTGAAIGAGIGLLFDLGNLLR